MLTMILRHVFYSWLVNATQMLSEIYKMLDHVGLLRDALIMEIVFSVIPLRKVGCFTDLKKKNLESAMLCLRSPVD